MKDRLVGLDYKKIGVYGILADSSVESYWQDWTYRIERAKEELEMIFRN